MKFHTNLGMPQYYSRLFTKTHKKKTIWQSQWQAGWLKNLPTPNRPAPSWRSQAQVALRSLWAAPEQEQGTWRWRHHRPGVKVQAWRANPPALYMGSRTIRLNWIELSPTKALQSTVYAFKNNNWYTSYTKAYIYIYIEYSRVYLPYSQW